MFIDGERGVRGVHDCKVLFPSSREGVDIRDTLDAEREIDSDSKYSASSVFSGGVTSTRSPLASSFQSSSAGSSSISKGLLKVKDEGADSVSFFHSCTSSSIDMLREVTEVVFFRPLIFLGGGGMAVIASSAATAGGMALVSWEVAGFPRGVRDPLRPVDRTVCVEDWCRRGRIIGIATGSDFSSGETVITSGSGKACLSSLTATGVDRGLVVSDRLDLRLEGSEVVDRAPKALGIIIMMAKSGVELKVEG